MRRGAKDSKQNGSEKSAKGAQGKSAKGSRSPARGDRHLARTRREMEQNLAYFAAHPKEIDARLSELSREPSLECLLAGGASGVSLLGAIVAVRKRRWLLLPLLGQSLLAWHALKGRSPLGDALRSLGVRTAQEISDERLALKVLRGDLPSPPKSTEAKDVLNGAREILASVRR